MSENGSLHWVSEVRRIPSLPHEVHHLIIALSKEEIDFRQLGKIIGAHPGIAARLIALSNSAWSAPISPITTIENACCRLGFSTVRSISIGLAVMSPFNTIKCPAFDIHRYWVSSMLVAEGAALLASATPFSKQNGELEQTARTAGIMHNLGLLCLAHQMPQETQQALRRISENPEMDLLNALRQSASTDYCEVGGLVADIWGIPENLATSIKHHRDFRYQAQDWELSRLVGIAAMLVSALFRNQEDLPQFQSCPELQLSHDFNENVFCKLRGQFDKTSEMAKMLFK